MKRLVGIMCIAALLSGIISCTRRDLLELENIHYVRVYIDENIKNVTTGIYNSERELPEYQTPDIVRVIACDPLTDKVVSERYLQNSGSDEHGKYLDGYINIPPGNYKLLAYSFGTKSCVLRNENTYSLAEAYTNNISTYLYGNFNSKDREDEKIVYDPDHLFVDTNNNLEIGYKSHIDTIYNENGEYLKAESIVKTYYIQITVEGAQYITSSVALLSGLGGSSILHTGTEPVYEPVTVYFDMVKSEEAYNTPIGSGAVTAELYGNFGTFGKLEGIASELELSFDVITVDGRKLSYKLDITDKFYEQATKDNQWIILNEKIVIPAPENVDNSGGFKPGVTEWEELRKEIYI